MKNIKIEKNFSIQEGSFIYTDFFESNLEKVALIFNASRKEPLAESAISLLLKVFHENFYQDIYDIEKRLRKAVLEMHWQLSAFFKREKKKFEISCFILVLQKNKIHFVQTGRIIAFAFGEKFEHLGVDINKIYDDNSKFAILGQKEENINVKVHQKKVSSDLSIVILPATFTKEFGKEISSKADFEKNFKQLVKRNKKPILKVDIPISYRLKYKKPFRITTKNTAIVMVIVIFLAGLHTIFGKKWSQGEFSSWKEFIDANRQTLINLVISSPKFEIGWEWIAPSEIATKPNHDIHNIYLTYNKTVSCIQKNSYNEIWKKSFSKVIRNSFLLREGKILIVDEQGSQYLMKRANGTVLWKKDIPIEFPETEEKTPQLLNIDYTRDGRLEKNYYILTNENTVLLISDKKGEIVDEKSFKEKVDFISDYDYIDKCFYITFGRKIVKVNLVL